MEEDMIVGLLLFLVALWVVKTVWSMLLLRSIRRSSRRQVDLLEELSRQGEARQASVAALQLSAAALQPVPAPQTAPVVVPAEPVVARVVPPPLPVVSAASKPVAVPGPAMTAFAEADGPSVALVSEPAVAGLWSAVGRDTPDSEQVSDDVPVLPREESAFVVAARTKLRRVGYWLLCGQTEAPSAGSMEKLVATTWLLRSGICVILFMVGFLLRLTITRGWLAPEGRVTLSVVAGAGLLFWGLKLLNGRYRALGQAVMGIALVTFYFSAFAATSMYHLLPAMASFVIMAIITAAAGFMAVRFNTAAVAVIALIGGYGTPIMLNTGQKNYVGLFAYMLLLGCGVLAVAARRNWLPLNWLGMLLTYVLFVGAWDAHYVPADFPVLMTALLLFFIQYSTVIFIHNVLRKESASTLELLALLVNVSFCVASGYRLLGSISADRIWNVPLLLFLAAFYIAHAYFLLVKKYQDRGLLLCFIGLSALMLTLAVPMAFSAEWLGAAWALLALLMLWLGYSLESRFLRSAAWGLFALVLLRMSFWDFGAACRLSRLPAEAIGAYWGLLLGRLVQFGVPLLSLAFAARLAQRPPAGGDLAVPAAGGESSLRRCSLCMPGWVYALAAGLFFVYWNFETYWTVGRLFQPFRLPALTLVWLVVAGIFAWTALRVATGASWWSKALGLCLAAIVLKLFFWDFMSWRPGLRLLYAGDFSWLGSLMRLADFGPLIAFLVFIWLSLGERDAMLSRIAGALWPVLLFVYLTWELNTMLHYYVSGLRAGGISVLWGSFAAALVYRGLRQPSAVLRYLGLALFALVVGKVFVYDLSRLSNVYRVIAFLGFGILLMAGAFFYLRFWQTEDKT